MTPQTVVLDLNEFGNETIKIIFEEREFILPAYPTMELFWKISNVLNSGTSLKTLNSIVKEMLETREEGKLDKEELKMVDRINIKQLFKIAKVYVNGASTAFLDEGARQKSRTKSQEPSSDGVKT